MTLGCSPQITHILCVPFPFPSPARLWLQLYYQQRGLSHTTPYIHYVFGCIRFDGPRAIILPVCGGEAMV